MDSLQKAHHTLLNSQSAHDPIPRLHCELQLALPAGHPHSQSVKEPGCLSGAARLPWVLVTPSRPTYKAGDPGIRKDSGKVSGGFSCGTLFWGQSEQFPVFRLRNETIEI